MTHLSKVWSPRKVLARRRLWSSAYLQNLTEATFSPDFFTVFDRKRQKTVKTILLIFVDFAPSRFSRNKFEQATQPFHAESGHTQAAYASKIWFQKNKQSHLKEHKILETKIFLFYLSHKWIVEKTLIDASR